MWGAITSMEDIEIRWTRDDTILSGARARWYPEHRILLMDARLKRFVARCVLAHEIAHIICGDEPCDNKFYDYVREERADRIASRWLLPNLDAMASALSEGSTIGHAASILRVTADMLNARIANLSDFEHHHIDSRVAAYREMMGA